MKEGIIKYVVYIVIAISIISSCVTTDNYKYLSFVFDGVPNPDIKDSLENDLIDSSALIVAKDSTVNKPLVNKHMPYATNKCYSCHSKENMGGYIEPQPKLCYQCHENFNDQHKVVHGPAAGGYCTSCHHPHKAKERYLLVKTEQQLCFNCHDSTMVFENRFHKKIEEPNCTECHNPHGGENRYIMQTGACYKCHENFEKTYSFIHGPVNGGYCNTCHSTHDSGNKSLLKKEGQKVCFDCHNKRLVFENEHHKDENENCINCHNPHGGANRFFTSLN